MPTLPIPRLRLDDKPLTQKEANELLPKMKDIIKAFGKYMDQGITQTNRERAEAKIWRTLDAEEIDVIATHLVEMAQGSKLVATAVRRVTNGWRLLQLGLITGPRFWQTVAFYREHGGFALFGGGISGRTEKPAPAQNRGAAIPT